MGRLTILLILCVSANAAKKPKPPSQPPIMKECVTVYDVYSHGLSAFSGAGAAEPGLEAKILNGCGVTVYVSLRIGYFDKRGTQFAYGIAAATIGAGAKYEVRHEAMIPDYQRGAMKTATILSVEAYSQ